MKSYALLTAISLILLSLIPLNAFADNEMNIYIKHNRFLDSDGNTVHQFNYQIPNNELTFIESDEGFIAVVDVELSVGEEGEKILNRLSNNIGVRDKVAAGSPTHYFLDKISLTLAKADFRFNLKFIDTNSDKTFRWNEELTNLPSNSLVSDIEFSHKIAIEEAHPGFELFQRGDYHFHVTPTQVFNRTINDTVFFYYEIQNLYPAVDTAYYLSENINIYNESYESTITNNIKNSSTTLDRIHKINADTLAVGYYNIDITVHDRITNKKDTIHDYFVVSEEITRTESFFFDDKDKEYQLMRYFLPSSNFRNWDSLSSHAQNSVIDRFWKLNDPNPHTKENEFMEIVMDRYNYANSNFSHHRQGWETDMGRIYIRNGAPSDLERYTTDVDTKLTLKEYQVWKYNNLNRVYLFIDIQGNGNFRLVYNKNDDMETVMLNWERLLGEEFDSSKLE